MDTKPLIFISHIKEEKEIAFALKQLVAKTFLGLIDVFVSTDPTSIEMGEQWLQKIIFGLETCKVEIILASPESVKRAWINFEAGAGWIRDIPVIPLCHSGMTPDDLPSPLNSLQSAIASDEAGLRAIFPVLAKAIACELHEMNFTPFIETVKNFENVSQQRQAIAAQTPVKWTDGLLPHEFATLVLLADGTDAPGETVNITHLRHTLADAGFTGLAVTLALQMLVRKDFIVISREIYPDTYNHEEYPAARITPEGWDWIHANQDKIELRLPSPPAPDPSSAPSEEPSSEDEVPF